MPDKHENLEEILGSFLDEAEASRAADDIRQGQRLLEEFEAPEPSALLLDQIKLQISDKLAAARPAVRWVRRSVAMAAAVVIIGLGTALFFPSGGQEAFASPEGWWENKALKAMTAEMDEVLENIISISRDEYYTEDSGPDIDEMELEEMEMVAMNDDFWKG